ncbi:putative telomere length regulation protein [Blattamonas nauphoetae]|uniref:Telomere length regulation protein n=1 Tax=Blattamonas nauphoetae TaxID=2049346 RepID=A0ABQ9XBZ7_9EUKA|nr:putative telomere length regulation protein [Blattamonas nauphoetae]
MQACPPFLGICVELLPQLPPYSLETFLFRFIELGAVILQPSSMVQSGHRAPKQHKQSPPSHNNVSCVYGIDCIHCRDGMPTLFRQTLSTPLPSGVCGCLHLVLRPTPGPSFRDHPTTFHRDSSDCCGFPLHLITLRVPISKYGIRTSVSFNSLHFQNTHRTLEPNWNPKTPFTRLSSASGTCPRSPVSLRRLVIQTGSCSSAAALRGNPLPSLLILTSLNSLLSSPTALIRECAMIVTELFAPHLQPKQDNPLEATEPLKFEYDGFDRSLPDPSDPVSWSDSDTSVMFQLHSITGVEIDKSDVSRINEWKEEKDRIWKSLLSLNKPNEEEVHNSSSTATADSPITNTPTEQNPISSLRSDCVVESDSQEAPSSEELETWSDSDPDRPLFVRRTQIRKKSKKLEHSFYEIVPFNLDSAVINRIAHSSTLISYDQSINYKLQGSHQPKRSPDDEVLENTFSFDKKDTDWLDVAEVSLTGIVRGLLGMDLNEHPMEAMALLRKIPTAVHSTEPDVVDMALTAARVVATIQNIFDYPEYERVKQEALVSLLVSVKPDVAITLGNLFYSHSVTVANRVGILSSFAASAVFMSAGKSLSEVALQLDDSPPPDPQKEITVSSDTKKTQFNQTKTAESETKKPLIEILGESDPADRIPLDEQNKPIESVSIKPSKTRRWGYTTHNRKPPSPESINAFTPHGPAFFFALLSPLEPKILTSQTHVTYDYRARDAVQLVGDDSYVLSVLLQTLSTILWCTGFSPSPVHSDMPKSFLRAIYNFRPGASPFLLKAILVSIHTCFFCPLSSTTSLSELMNDANETIIWCDALIQNSPDREVYMLASELVLDLKRLYRIT